MGSKLVSSVVLLAILLELNLLLINQAIAELLVLVDLKIEAMDHALELANITIG
jgi:hypothetical protein